jgi:glycosyltransferase involved in cell wall biosynthesis
MPMNIWFVNHYAIAPNTPGGTRHYSLAKELVKRGHSVTIIASSFDYFTQTETKLSVGEGFRHETIDDVDFLWLRTPPYKGNSLGRVKNMLAFSRDIWFQKGLRNKRKPDVIYGSTPHLFAAYAARRLAKSLKIPFVLEVRDLWPQTLIDLGRISPRHPFIQVLERLEKSLYRSSNHIVSLLPFAFEHIVPKGGAKDSITWISNGIDLSMVPAPQPPEVRDTFNIFYTGAHGLANGLDVLLTAAAHLKSRKDTQHIRITLIGEGPEKKKLMERAKQEDLSNVAFCKALPKREVYSVAREADAFIALVHDSPLYKYGTVANKFFDYLAMARPTLMMTSARNNPIAEADAGITVSSGNVHGLMLAMVEIAQLTPQVRWEMGLRGRKYVEENFSFEQLAIRLETVLEQVVKNADSRTVH